MRLVVGSRDRRIWRDHWDSQSSKLVSSRFNDTCLKVRESQKTPDFNLQCPHMCTYPCMSTYIQVYTHMNAHRKIPRNKILFKVSLLGGVKFGFLSCPVSHHKQVFYAIVSYTTNFKWTVNRTCWNLQWQTSLCPFTQQIPCPLDFFAFKREE